MAIGGAWVTPQVSYYSLDQSGPQNCTGQARRLALRKPQGSILDTKLSRKVLVHFDRVALNYKIKLFVLKTSENRESVMKIDS